MTKLTLSVEKDVVAQAKKLSAERGTSVSAMFTHFIRSAGRSKGLREIGPLTRKATGLARLPRGKSDRGLLADALAEKYGIGK